MSYLASFGTDAVKIWFIDPRESEREKMDAAVRRTGQEAARHDVPLIVHATGLREAKIAVQAGAHLLVHSVWDQAVDDDFIDSALETGTIYNPTLTVMGGYQRMAVAVAAGVVPEVDDPNGCLGEATMERVRATASLDPSFADPDALERRGEALAEREAVAASNLVRLAQAGVPIAMGTDAGNPLTLHGPSVYAEMEAMEAAGLEPMTVVVAATLNAARAMGRDKDLGSLEAGKQADLLILGADPLAGVSAFRRIEWVIRGGEARSPAEISEEIRSQPTL